MSFYPQILYKANPTTSRLPRIPTTHTELQRLAGAQYSPLRSGKQRLTAICSMHTYTFLLCCFFPFLALSLPTQQAAMLSAPSFSAGTFPDELFTCYTTRYSPEISALEAAIASLSENERTYCIPAGGVADEKVAGVINVEGTGKEDRETCFLPETALQQLVERCGYEERVGGEVRLPIGDVVLRLGDRMPL
ncbi:hypothetical protein FN846DRAFT_170864 [Sphaerosporella brunnea]|uniref:Uncharacterized protein n=1 Tax=Sphaerosporella brunnea TaxID=1250544 RepID=A0A5J5EQS6_9PEZI|nr:hypothetical protein FN846DRAFT_170864 [Sphaerosporella brunnea]